MMRALLSILIVVASAVTAQSATYLATNLTEAAVQTAINSATDGDTVQLPAGTSTWTTNITINGKAINLVGAGVSQTIITDQCNPALYLINFKTMLNKPFTASDFTIVQSAIQQSTASLNIEHSVGFRITRVNFTNVIERGIYTGTQTGRHSIGVVDHCVFNSSVDGTQQGITVAGNDHKNPTNYNASGTWTESPKWGTTNAFYVENCTFDFEYDGDAAIELYNGATIVVRYCLFRNSGMGGHGFDSSSRSAHWWEFYKNTLNSTLGSGRLVGQFRGGSGVWWSNVYNCSGSGFAEANKIRLSNYRATYDRITTYGLNGFLQGGMKHDGNTGFDSNSSGTHDGASSSASLVDSTKSWTTNQWLANGTIATEKPPFYLWNRTKGCGGWVTSNSTTTVYTYSLTNIATGASSTWDSGDVYVLTRGYPGLDQIGRVGPTVFHATYSEQVLEPLYQWSNTFNNSMVGAFPMVVDFVTDVYTNVVPNPSYYIVEGREFYNDTPKPGYVALSYPHPLVVASLYYAPFRKP